MSTSNLTLCSNLMIEDADHQPEHHYLPGDFVGTIYPGYVNKEVMARHLTAAQRAVLLEALVCTVCGRPCAGTCGA